MSHWEDINEATSYSALTLKLKLDYISRHSIFNLWISTVKGSYVTVVRTCKRNKIGLSFNWTFWSSLPYPLQDDHCQCFAFAAVSNIIHIYSFY